MTRALLTLKAKELKHLAFLTGCQLSTTKALLQQGLADRLRYPLIKDGTPRIVSVDMGIRNLAYSVVNLDKVATPKQRAKQHGFDSSMEKVSISHWQKLDLVAQLQQATSGKEDTRSTEESNPIQNAGIFTAPVISQIALSFVQIILEHRPSTILIERQRFRSGGGSAIQEWTIRVNMLESMLWACLATMERLSKTDNAPFPTIYSVEPARVAKFWVAADKMPLDISLDAVNAARAEESVVDAEKPGKITKAQRIAILRNWIVHKSNGLSTLEFTGQAKQTVEAFERNKSKAKVVESVGKLDDLTDCLLQAMAWVRWEANRRTINTMLDAS